MRRITNSRVLWFVFSALIAWVPSASSKSDAVPESQGPITIITRGIQQPPIVHPDFRTSIPVYAVFLKTSTQDTESVTVEVEFEWQGSRRTAMECMDVYRLGGELFTVVLVKLPSYEVKVLKVNIREIRRGPIYSFGWGL